MVLHPPTSHLTNLTRNLDRTISLQGGGGGEGRGEGEGAHNSLNVNPDVYVCVPVE